MHYIIGEVDIQVRLPQRGKTDPTSLMYNRYVGLFEGKLGTYCLYYISPVRAGGKFTGKVEYTFANDQTKEQVKLQFESTEEADRCIAALKGETLPNYADVYENLSD